MNYSRGLGRINKVYVCYAFLEFFGLCINLDLHYYHGVHIDYGLYFVLELDLIYMHRYIKNYKDIKAYTFTIIEKLDPDIRRKF